jgi:predicted amidophosphoribosyltransferase
VSLLSGGTARRLVEPVLAVVFPPLCPVCAEPPSPRRGPLCDPCWQALPRHRGLTCACGMPGGRAVCGRCRRGLQPLAAGASLGPYEGGLRALLHELSGRGQPRLAARLAEALLADEAARRVLAAGGLLVPIPLHPRRRRERGFSPSGLLARELARRSGLPCSEEALVRRLDTPPPAGLSAARWRKDVARAFAVRRRAQIAGRVVVLVDDLLASGATARACARALRAADAAEVRVLTVARVA